MGGAAGGAGAPAAKQRPRQNSHRRIPEQVQRTPAFWNLVAIHGLGCAGHNIILVLLVAIAEAAGVVESMAALIYLTLTVVSTATRFATPVLADRLGSKAIMGVCFSLQVFPIPAAFRCRRYGFRLFPVRRAVRHRAGRRNDGLSHHQPPVLRRRAHRHGLRLADGRRRHGHGAGAGSRRLPARPHRRLHLVAMAIAGLERNRRPGHNPPAHHPPPPTAGLGRRSCRRKPAPRRRRRPHPPHPPPPRRPRATATNARRTILRPNYSCGGPMRAVASI